MTTYIDAHTHYLPEKFNKEENAKRVQYCVNSITENDWDGLICAAQLRSDMIPFLGIHPWHAAATTTGWDERLRSKLLQLKGSHPVGIGECGLDRAKEFSDLQRSVCKTQLMIAKEIQVPLSIHCVRAYSDLLELFKVLNMKDTPILLHAFSGNKEVTSRFLKWNVFFSISLPRNSHTARGTCGDAPPFDALKTLLKNIPQDRLLIESDTTAPTLSNDRQSITEIYPIIAQLLDISNDECAEIVASNFNRYLTGA